MKNVILAIVVLFLSSDILAVDPIDGTDGNDLVTGTDGDDKICGFDGDDELRGGAGDDILIGGRGSDIMFGGSGADNFVIDYISLEPDEIMDFRPEEGDTLSLRLLDTARQQIVTNSIGLNSKGVITFQLLGGKQVEAVNLNRRDLSLKVDAVGKKIYLGFSLKF